MFDERAVLEYGGLLAAGYGLYQSKSIHEIELEKAKQRHQEALELAKSQHEIDMKTAKQTYLLELFNSLEQHFQQLNADLIASSRESERDMFDQRNQSFQTIILASSVMFSALASIIVDGNLPVDTGDLLLIGYALTCSLSFSFLFLSIVFCIELVIRTSSFMYKRGKLHTKTLRKAINDTKGMMRDLRGEGKGPNSLKEESNSSLADAGNTVDTTKDENTSNKLQEPAESMKQSFSMNNLGESSNVQGFRRAISQMEPNEIETEFNRHEIEIRGYLRKREILNDTAAITSYQDEKSGRKKPFKHFWEESCETWWVLAILLFYGGSLNMLLALMIYMWATFFIFNKSITAAIIGVSVLGLVSIIGIGTVVVMRHVDRATHKREMDLLMRGAQGQNQLQQELQEQQLPDEGSRQDFTSSTAEDTESERAGLRSRWGGSPFSRRKVTRSDSNGSFTGAESTELPERAYSPNKHARVLTTWPVSRSASKRGGTSVQSTGSDRSGQATAPPGYHSQPSHQTPHSQCRPPTGRCPSSATSNNNNARADPYYSPSNPHGLATHLEDDLESGTVRSNSTTPSTHHTPRLRHAGTGGSPRFSAEHLYQEEPSPRRRFLSSFGRSSSRPTPSSRQSSLYESSLCRTPADSRATPLPPNPAFVGTPVIGTPMQGAVNVHQTPQSHAQRALSYLTPQGPGTGRSNQPNTLRVPNNTPMSGLDTNYESSSDLSGTMGGGITF